jgi:8-oxo-dGTP pyrophosphatase MutT (NUDIX family)
VSLARSLRDALDLGARRAPDLLPGDERDVAADADQPLTQAAVLVPVTDRAEPGVILTLRTDTVRRHAGQVAFPGGRVDPGDAGPVEAALREAQEEIGLDPRLVDLVGTADTYRTITGYQVTPVLGVVPPDLALRAEPAEVAAIFEVPLAHLLDPAQHRIRTIDWQGAERTYFEIMWGERRIWGATAAMIVNLSRRLALVA